MKSYRRYFSLLLCLVLLLSAFSFNVAAAEQLESKPYNIYATQYLKIATTNTLVGEMMIYPTDNEQQIGEIDYQNIPAAMFNNPVSLTTTYYYANNDNSSLLAGGNSYDIYLGKVQEDGSFTLTTTTGTTSYNLEDYVPEVNVILYGESGKTYQLDNEQVTDGSYCFNINVKANVTENINKIALIVHWDLNKIWNTLPNNKTSMKLWYQMGECFGNEFTMNLVQGDPYQEELDEIKTGIGGIIGWLRDLWTSIKDGFSAIGDSISGLGDTISNAFSQLWEWLGNIANTLAELPAMIWGYIQDGIMYLFVPTDEQMVEFKERWNNILEDRFGAVWQVIDLMSHCLDGVNDADQLDTISIPLISIDLPENNSFEFGGYDVKIVPDGMEFVADAVKMAVGCVATLMFVNGLRKRYDEVFH